MLTLGSLFDGIGGFPLAAVHNGICPVWASEIETFPIEVTRIRFPGMFHAGDITKIKGAELPPVDIVCGGSPCQDLSVAGKRQGLAGERSGLFMEQVRIVKEMREADGRRGIPDDLIRPRYLVWENVPGAFSSAGGEDFRAVIEEIIRIKDSACHVPKPDTGRWEPAGAAVLGDQFSLAWRVLDAQYWGVPQRRRRIFLVADFGGRTAYQILFEQYGLQGDTAEVESEGKGTARPTEGGIGDTGRERMTAGHGHQPMVFDNHGQDQRYKGPVDVSQTVMACFGTGGNNQPLVLASGQGGAEIGVGICPTITGAAGTSGNNQPLLYENRHPDTPFPLAVSLDSKETNRAQETTADRKEVLCIVGNIIDRQPQNGGNGIGYQPGIAYTLTATDHHAVFTPQDMDEDSLSAEREMKAAGPEESGMYQTVVGALCRDDEKGIGSQYVSQDKCIIEKKNLIRRLTPLECERLQGFPDGWTNIPGASDSARYKALGNSVAVPCVDFVLRGIAYFLRKQERI